MLPKPACFELPNNSLARNKNQNQRQPEYLMGLKARTCVKWVPWWSFWSLLLLLFSWVPHMHSASAPAPAPINPTAVFEVFVLFKRMSYCTRYVHLYIMSYSGQKRETWRTWLTTTTRRGPPIMIERVGLLQRLKGRYARPTRNIRILKLIMSDRKVLHLLQKFFPINLYRKNKHFEVFRRCSSTVFYCQALVQIPFP